jgi:hypothetical protein
MKRERLLELSNEKEAQLVTRKYSLMSWDKIKLFISLGGVVVLIHTYKREKVSIHLVCPWRHNA